VRRGRFAIRRFQPEDAECIWNLHRAALAGTGAEAYEKVWLDLRDIQANFLAKDGEFLIGLVRDELVAMGGVVPMSTESVEVKRMRVHPQWQRRGFGAAILRALEEYSLRRGHSLAHLETTEIQATDLFLYKSQGYTEVGRFTKTGLVVVQLQKRLAPIDLSAQNSRSR